MKEPQQKSIEESKTPKIIAAIIVALLFFWIVGAFTGSGENTETAKSNEKQSSAAVENESKVADNVKAALDALDEETKSYIASTSTGGYQGSIEKVEPYGDDGVKVYVTTNFIDTKDEADSGKNIAHKIMANTCIDVPELNSVYVHSTSSGLDSRSVYRSDIPACKQ